MNRKKQGYDMRQYRAYDVLSRHTLNERSNGSVSDEERNVGAED